MVALLVKDQFSDLEESYWKFICNVDEQHVRAPYILSIITYAVVAHTGNFLKS